MPIKLNISDKGKAWRIEIDAEVLAGKSVGDKVEGKDVSADLHGYELEITGGSDISGFPLYKEAEGIGLKRVLLTKGWGMRDSTEGIRRRKTVRGKTISAKVSQLYLKVLNHGAKKLHEIFPEQNVAKEKKEAVKTEVAPQAQ